MASVAARIDADLAFQFQIGRLAQIMHQQHIFRWNGGVGLQLIDPMAVGPLLRQDGIGGGADRRRSCVPIPDWASRPDNAPATHIPLEWWRRPPTHRPNGRRAFAPTRWHRWRRG